MAAVSEHTWSIGELVDFRSFTGLGQNVFKPGPDGKIETYFVANDISRT